MGIRVSRYMKKVLTVFLAGCMFLPMAGCGEESGRWNAMSSAFTDIAEVDSDQSYRKTSVYTSSGVSDATVLHIESKLASGFYRFSTEISIDNNSTDNFMVCELRVYDEDRELIGYRNVKRRDFTDTNVFQNMDVTFQVVKSQKIVYEINWVNYATLRYRETALDKIAPHEHIVQNIDAYLGGASAPTYDADALYYFDVEAYIDAINDTRIQYDIVNLCATLQGLANRDGIHLYLKNNVPQNFSLSVEDYWLEYLSQDGRMLAGKEVVRLHDVDSLLTVFSDVYNGYVVWDEDVPATSNVAATISGVDGLLPVRYDSSIGSLYDCLINRRGGEVKVDLNDKFVDKNYEKYEGKAGKIWDTDIDSTCSAKNDAYLWAIDKYLDKTNKTLAGWQLDAYSWDTRQDEYRITTYYDLQRTNLPNRDYLVQNKAFVFDLSIHDGLPSSDDRNQKPGTDYKTLTQMLTLMNQRAEGKIVKVLGFIPWFIKYTSDVWEYMPEGVAANEWASITLFTRYNVVTDNDAPGFTDISNCSIFSRFKAKEQYSQIANTSKEEIARRVAQYTTTDTSGKVTVKPKNYVLMYMGDYDGSAWTNQSMIKNMNDPNLGKYPLAWPVNVALADRIPHAFDAMYENFTENDYFVGDHNGYGYFDLNVFEYDSLDGVTVSLENYFNVSQKYWTRYDLDLMGWVLVFDQPSSASSVWKYMSELAPRGVISSHIPVGGLYSTDRVKNVPYTTMNGAFGDSVEENVGNMGRLGIPTIAQFTSYRSILKSPTFITQVLDGAIAQYPENEITPLDPYTFMELVRIANGG